MDTQEAGHGHREGPRQPLKPPSGRLAFGDRLSNESARRPVLMRRRNYWTRPDAAGGWGLGITRRIACEGRSWGLPSSEPRLAARRWPFGVGPASLRGRRRASSSSSHSSGVSHTGSTRSTSSGSGTSGRSISGGTSRSGGASQFKGGAHPAGAAHSERRFRDAWLQGPAPAPIRPSLASLAPPVDLGVVRLRRSLELCKIRMAARPCAVVRLRGEYINSQQPVLTNAGRTIRASAGVHSPRRENTKASLRSEPGCVRPVPPSGGPCQFGEKRRQRPVGIVGLRRHAPCPPAGIDPPRALLRCSWLGSVASFVPGVLRREWSRDERPGIIT